MPFYYQMLKNITQQRDISILTNLLPTYNEMKSLKTIYN